MINKIIEFSAAHRGLVITMTLALILIGFWSMRRVSLDAIPDLSDPQVIIYTEWPGRSPELVEDQITYPVVSSLLGAPHVSAVRGLSDYGFSYVTVIFDEGTDIYWGRSRVLEYMAKLTGRLPQGVTPALGPDATGVGWAFEYALVDKSGKHNLAELRSFQDWYLRYWIQSVPGVAEVASVGGYTRQYQVNVDPAKLLAYNVPLNRVIDVIRKSNNEVGGRVVEFSGKEYLVRGRGYISSIRDIADLAVGSGGAGTPIRIADVATVEMGPDMRRGVAELNGEGEVAGGIVVVRFGQNVMDVLERVREKIRDSRPSFPEGVELVITYDRSDLIERSIHTLKETLIEELIIVSLVILIFLWHVPSAIIPILTIPVAVLLSFIPMYGTGMTSNIMSLGGIAIAIGAMVDAAIVVVEQTHKKLERWESDGRPGSAARVVVDAVKEVGGPSFFSLLVIAVSFMPIFALQYQEGRLFKPLAFTKNFSMIVAAFLAITLDPAIRVLFLRTKPFSLKPRWLNKAANAVLVGTIHHEDSHPLSRPLMRIYHPVVRFVLDHKWFVIGLAALLVALTVPVFFALGSEFMPPLDEGTLLYMPITLPGISITEAGKYLQLQDRLIRQFPEIQSVFGKAGKAETATDPAPLSMVETTIMLRPENEWRMVRHDRWYTRGAPEFLKTILRVIWPEERRMTPDELIDELDRAVQIPAYANAWLYPIRTRIDMITTGIRTPVGIKILGPDLDSIQSIGLDIERILKPLAGTRSAFFERVTGGYYLDFRVRRDQAARFDLTVDDVNEIIESAIGGNTVTTTIEGRERYPVNVRYARDFRDDLEKLGRVLVPAPSGAQVPLAQLAEITMQSGPPMINDESGFRSGRVYVDVVDRDLGSYVGEARERVAREVKLPAGYSLVWSGQAEYLERVAERLWIVVPLTLLFVTLLIYFNTRSLAKTLIILIAVPFSAIGAIWLLYFLHYNLSIAVWVGLIALLGVDAETGVFMLLYLDLAYQEMKQKGKMQSLADLKEAIEHGAVKRLRPKLMTAGVMFMGLLPIMWSSGAGSDVMRRIAAPMIGGIFTSFLLELMVYPAIYELWRGRSVRQELPAPETPGMPMTRL